MAKKQQKKDVFEKKVSRRDFMKGTAMATAAAAVGETAADEVRNIFHGTAASNILEIDRHHLGAIFGEAEVCKLGVAVHVLRCVKIVLGERPAVGHQQRRTVRRL